MNPEFCNKFNTKRGYLVLDSDKCNHCGLCDRRCPHRAIKVTTTEWRLKLICMKCGRCVRECPNKALSLEKQKN